MSIALNDDQKSHVAQLADEFERRMAYKYTKGAEEHGGNLWEMPSAQILDEALNEVVDLAVYLMTLRKQLEVNHPADITPPTAQQWIDGYHAAQAGVEAPDD